MTPHLPQRAIVLTALLYGGVSTLVIAWACAFAVPVTGPADSLEHIVLDARTTRTTTIHRRFGHERINIIVGGLQLNESRTDYVWIEPMDAISHTLPREDAWSISRAGWPLPALACTNHDEAVISTGPIFIPLAPGGTDRERPRGIEHGIPLPSHRGSFAGGWRALPFEPLWPGLLTDIAFYGVLWLIAFNLPAFVRARTRRARGRCPRCAYDLQRNLAAGCPECGWARSPGP